MEQTTAPDPSPLLASLDAEVRAHGPIRSVLPFIEVESGKRLLGAMIYFHDGFNAVCPVGEDVTDVMVLVKIVTARYLDTRQDAH